MTVCRDLDRLDPTFRLQVEKLVEYMTERGWKPVVWETYRSPERARELMKRGTSKNGDRSMHCLGLACDIVDGDFHNVKGATGKESYWTAPPAFWADLEDGAQLLGLTRLFKMGKKDIPGQADSWDLPHVQAVKVGEQNKVRAMKPAELAAFVKAKFKDPT